MKNNTLIMFSFLLLLSSCGGDKSQTFQGYVEGENIYIACPYEGVLIHKLVSRGQAVKKGELLFQLDNNPEALLASQGKAGVAEAQAALLDLQKPRRTLEIDAIQDQINQVEANLVLANLRVKRYQDLYKKQAVELDRVDEVLTTQHGLQASKAQFQANLDLAKLGARDDQIKTQMAKLQEVKFALSVGQWKLSQKKLYAAADGVMFDTYYQEGEFTTAGKPIAALLPFTSIRVEFFVPANALPTIELNQKIQFTCEGCSKTNEAIINYISPEAEYVPPLVYTRANTENLVFRVKAQITHPTSFKPGQPVSVVVGTHHGK